MSLLVFPISPRQFKRVFKVIYYKKNIKKIKKRVVEGTHLRSQGRVMVFGHWSQATRFRCWLSVLSGGKASSGLRLRGGPSPRKRLIKLLFRIDWISASLLLLRCIRFTTSDAIFRETSSACTLIALAALEVMNFATSLVEIPATHSFSSGLSQNDSELFRLCIGTASSAILGKTLVGPPEFKELVEDGFFWFAAADGSSIQEFLDWE